MFHVSQLKKVEGEALDSVTIPLQLTKERVLVAEPEAVMNSRIHPVSGQQEVLIKWKGLPDFDSSWEWRKVIQGQFPDFNLEDKVDFDGGGIDTYASTHPPIIYQYQRRRSKK